MTKISIILSLFFLGTAHSAIASSGTLPLVPDLAIAETGQHVVINIPQLRLFFYEEGQLVKSYQITVGKASTKTPPGDYTTVSTVYNPTWTIPASIKRERAARGQADISSIPPGPNNPLGPVFVRLAGPASGIGIHGTNAPKSIPGFRSHGCIRMRSPEAMQFSKAIKAKVPVSIIYQNYSLNEDENKNLWVAAYPDPYGRKGKAKTQLTDAIMAWAENYQAALDPVSLESILKKNKGQAFCLTCTEAKPTVAGKLEAIAWTDAKGITREQFIEESMPVPEMIPYTPLIGTHIIEEAESEMTPITGIVTPQ